MPNDTPTSSPEASSTPPVETPETRVDALPSPETEAASLERKAKREQHEGVEAAERDEVLPKVEKKIDEQGNPIEGEAAEEKPKDPMGMLDGLMQKFEGLKKQFLPMLAQMANVLPFLRKMVLDSGIFDGKEFSLLQASKKHSFEFHESVLKKNENGSQSFILPPDMDKLSADDVLGMFDKQKVGPTLEQEELVQIVQAAVGKKEAAAAEAAKKAAAAAPVAGVPAKPGEAPAEVKDNLTLPEAVTFDQLKDPNGVQFGPHKIHVQEPNVIEVDGKKWELKALRPPAVKIDPFLGTEWPAKIFIKNIAWVNNALQLHIDGSLAGISGNKPAVEKDRAFAVKMITHLATSGDNLDIVNKNPTTNAPEDSGVSLVKIG